MTKQTDQEAQQCMYSTIHNNNCSKQIPSYGDMRSDTTPLTSRYSRASPPTRLHRGHPPPRPPTTTQHSLRTENSEEGGLYPISLTTNHMLYATSPISNLPYWPSGKAIMFWHPKFQDPRFKSLRRQSLYQFNFS